MSWNKLQRSKSGIFQNLLVEFDYLRDLIQTYSWVGFSLILEKILLSIFSHIQIENYIKDKRRKRHDNRKEETKRLDIFRRINWKQISS